MTIKSGLVIVALGVSVLTLASCGIRGGTHNETTVNTTTTGEQLIDLQQAYEDGVITEDEYNKKKEEILKAPE